MSIALNGYYESPVTMPASKIKSLDELGAIVERIRAVGGGKVVQCHGVFDLLHVGHIRHLRHARRLGDVLVVTLTPDRHVNKGPHRPAFGEALRAEAVASLDCVDYVAINQGPTAVEAIRILRPEIYVKGPDYRDAGRDISGGIRLERSAVEETGGRLVCTDDITFSSTELLNRHLPAFAPQVSAYLERLRTGYAPERVCEYLDNLRTLRVLVVGETIIDEYRYCEAIGKSSKEPMLAIRQVSAEKFAGGVLAIANHAANFCGSAGLITAVGDEDSQTDFIREKLHPRIDTRMIRRHGSPTLVKRRFIDNYFFTKMLEVYEMDDRELSGADQEQLCGWLCEQLPLFDVTIVADFGHGFLNRQAVEVIERRARFLAINTQSNAANLGYHTVSKYRRADYVCVTENELRLDARDRMGDMRGQILGISDRLGGAQVMVTRGKAGCVCYRREEGFVEAPSLAGQVVDRVGAGDAVLSISAMCAMRKVPAPVMAFIANAVGAQAVATVGNRSAIESAGLYKQIGALLR